MKEIIDITKNLVQFKTMHSKPDEIRQCTAFIEQYLSGWDISYRHLDYYNTPAILVLPEEDKASILLMSHIDVVDAPDTLFIPVMKNGKLYGRGCYDDKYAVALSLVLLKNKLHQFRKQGRGQEKLPFGVLITSDEEIGGFSGAKKTLSGIQTDFCIVLDGGNIETIVVKEKGVARVKLVCRLKKKSNSEARFGINAVEKLNEDIQFCKTHFVKSKPENKHRALICNDIRLKNSRFGVPESAEADLEVRYTASDDLERLFDTMEKELYSDVVVENINALFPGGDPEHLKMLLKISKKTRVGFEDGENDSRFLSPLGIKGIVWGANGNRSQHKSNEHVDIKSIYELYALLDTFIRQCQPQNWPETKMIS